MKAATVIATIFAGVVVASPVANKASGASEANIEKRCLYDSCQDCYSATPPQGPGGIGSSTGHIIYCATSCC
ncbi:hypothetical protein BN1723_014900 [Verticillium longisporum]|uniref:Uncharacterized protein n=1 Tax=Verticillium longisporum TaxID=100787 RepID=A0A0G4MKC2_VERLO|nr:hypothetical protein HYQ44_001860 [Verticillium longisporum]KAG7152818.1 hypothetical protein HYQ46_005295 [Verticillium longisporum]CRK18256.1 hypothetical protein BN1708_012293 [Verticillium longisporum]CRK34701.1 hypothetical protein BN1723_014900 [Verticillium longisporum]